MVTNKLIEKLLRFNGLKVTDLSFKQGSKVEISTKLLKNGCQCPSCGRKGKIVRTRPKVRKFRDIPVCGWTV